jgi:hypothetical protein
MIAGPNFGSQINKYFYDCTGENASASLWPAMANGKKQSGRSFSYGRIWIK